MIFNSANTTPTDASIIIEMFSIPSIRRRFFPSPTRPNLRTVFSFLSWKKKILRCFYFRYYLKGKKKMFQTSKTLWLKSVTTIVIVNQKFFLKFGMNFFLEILWCIHAKDLTINSLSTHLNKKKHYFSFLPFYVTERKRERNKEK